MQIRKIKNAAIAMLLPIGLGLTSCNQDELSRAEQQRDSLRTVLQQRETALTENESTLNEFIESFNEVERNLDSVAARQNLIYSSAEGSKGELRGNQRDKINAQINAINDLMEQNRKTIASLQKKLSQSGRRNKKLQQTVETLTSQLARKDQELADLNARLESLNLKVAQLQTNLDSLTAFSAGQGRSLEEKIAALHTAYYIVGRGKDLREAKIIDKKGGLLGIGRTSQLTQGFDRSKFTRIDYTENTSIPVNSKQVRLITHHPADSYRLERDENDRNVVTTLVIDNPERFWSVSKFLVIEGNPAKARDRASASAASAGEGH